MDGLTVTCDVQVEAVYVVRRTAMDPKPGGENRQETIKHVLDSWR